jgi:hypothetical protein
MSYSAIGAATITIKPKGGPAVVVMKNGVETPEGAAYYASRAAKLAAATPGGVPVVPIALGIAVLGGGYWWWKKRRSRA